MGMSPAVRKLSLTVHVASSVGWLGAVAVFLALAIAGLVRQEPETVRGAYVAMALTGWLVIVPLCLASLVTGIIQGLGTPWGLFRHYWVVVKLLMTAFATLVLLVHMRPIDFVAGVAAERALSSSELRTLRVQLAADAGAALVVLLVTTTLSVYKPRGLTNHGRRKQREWGV
jgi:hypothetical protein